MERRNKRLFVLDKSMLKLAVICFPLLMGACGTKKALVNDSATTSASVSKNTSSSRGQQDETVQKLSFVQKVSDNQVYTKNITGKMKFELVFGDKNIEVDGSLNMRKDEVIRIQLNAPFLGFEVGRMEFTPTYVLIVDRMHKEYIKADYNQVDFLKKQGVNFYSLQALFWNQLLLPGTQKVSESDLKKFDANLAVSGNAVPVTYKQGNMTYAWTADRTSGRISQADVTYKTSTTSNLHVDYSNFKSVGVKMFPATQAFCFKTDATKQMKQLKFTIKMNEVKTDSKWEAETKVSDKYKQVSPEDVLGKIMGM